MDDIRKRLLYQSWHRGNKETDELLGQFARSFLEKCSEEELNLFARFSAEDDYDIWHWATGEKPTPQEYQPLMAQILDAQKERNN
jgi:succinate dehydrogenase flavin-adding protein (antitoxin of CptAB toxin-antitoxin module)